MKNLAYALLLSLLACKSNPQTSTISKMEKIAFDKLGDSLEKQPNSSNTYLLFSQKPNPQTHTRVIKAIVIEVASGKIVAEETFVPGYIKWIGDTSLELLSVLGTLRANEDLSDHIRIINLPILKP